MQSRSETLPCARGFKDERAVIATVDHVVKLARVFNSHSPRHEPQDFPFLKPKASKIMKHWADPCYGSFRQACCFRFFHKRIWSRFFAAPLSFHYKVALGRPKRLALRLSPLQRACGAVSGIPPDQREVPQAAYFFCSPQKPISVIFACGFSGRFFCLGHRLRVVPVVDVNLRTSPPLKQSACSSRA